MQLNSISLKSGLPLCLVLGLALSACSKQEEAAGTSAGSAAPNSAASSGEGAAAAEPAAPAVAASVQAMSAEELRDAASLALRENRMYAPAGNNAMEYYLALRDKLPDDAAVRSALTDLMPYAINAAENAISREQFDEGQRLLGLIEKADETAPALPRIRQSIGAAQQAVAKRSETEAARARAEAEARVAAEQQRTQQQRAAEAEAARRLVEQQEQARLAAERQAAEQRAAEQQRAAAAQAAAQQAAARPAAPAQRALKPISMPPPRYPPDALRSGTGGEVLVEFTVGTNGEVTEARVVRSNPARIFDREATNAVRRWRFEPVDAPVTTRRTLAFNPQG